jgi:hypothetical protein
MFEQPDGMPVTSEEEPVAPTHPDPATLAKESTADINGQPMQVTTALRTDDLAANAALEVVETARPANMDDSGRVHFLRSVEGEETCGTCGVPWPCDGHNALQEKAMHLTGQQAQQTTELGITRDEFAMALGISRQELDDRLTQQ